MDKQYPMSKYLSMEDCLRDQVKDLRAQLSTPTPPDSAGKLDADLLFDAYKAVLVLHRMLDKQGLEMGVKAANEIADRIVEAHPEFPGLTALRAKGVR